jgi:hypothetical protein
MVRFALRLAGLGRKAATVNEAGGPAFAKTPEQELVELLLACTLQGGFYRTASDEHQRLVKLITSVDPLFAAQAALYARHVFGMRTTSHVVAGELSRIASGKPWLRHFYNWIVRRPNDMREIAAYLLPGGLRDAGREARMGRTLPSALKKGFASAFGRFDAWQLASARGEGSTVSLVDLVRLVHPRPTAPVSALVSGTLRSAKFDAALTRTGQSAANGSELATLKAEAWAEALPRMGYNALVLSARRILEQVPELGPKLAARLADHGALRGSLILPLQLWQAYLAVQEARLPESSLVLAALSVGIDRAIANVPQLPGRTLVVYDSSGSMGSACIRSGPFVRRSPIQAAALFTAVLARALNAEVMHFADTAHYVAYNGNDSVLTLAARFGQVKTGGTNFDAPFAAARRAYDRIILLSDMQGWMGAQTPDNALRRYKERCNAHSVRLFSIDLTGYSTAQFPAEGVTALSGLNFAIFDVLRLAETDRLALQREIESVEFNAEWVARQKRRAA